LSYNWIRLALQGAGLIEKRARHDKCASSATSGHEGLIFSL
jgi:hypothetical protein